MLDVYTQKSGADAENQQWQFDPDPANSGYWFIHNPASGNVIEIQGDSSKFGTPLDAHSKNSNDSDNQLWRFIPDPANSGFCYIQSKLNDLVIDIKDDSTSAGAALHAYPLKVTDDGNQLWKVVDGAFPAVVSMEQAPTDGLGSNSNYFISDSRTTLAKGYPFVDTSFVFEVFEDMVVDGFSLQLNGWSPSGDDKDIWQQYGVGISPGTTQLQYFAENWPSTGPNLFNISPTLHDFSDGTWPAGWTLVIDLIYEDEASKGANGGGQVNGAQFTLNDNKGEQITSQPITLLQKPLATPGDGNVTTQDLSPILSISIALVFWAGGDYVKFKSGAGRFTLSAPGNQLVASASKPTWTPAPGGTGESSNTLYSELPSKPDAGQKVVQSWGVAPDAAIKKSDPELRSRKG